MKNIIILMLFLCVTQSLLAIKSDDIDDFLAIAQKINKGDFRGGIADCVGIADNNELAATALYLIYSRGYCGEQINYSKSAKYFDKIFHSRFHTEEYMYVWSKMRLPATITEKSATIKAYNGNSHIIDEKFNLKGKYSLAGCYQEERDNIGGVAARTLFVVGWPLIKQQKELRNRMIELARNMGSGSALYWPFIDNNSEYHFPKAIPKEHFERLQKSAKAGHIPSKLTIAALLQENSSGIVLNPIESGKLLREVVSKCNEYEKLGCTHAKVGLETAKKLLQAVPDDSLTTDELINELTKTQSESYPNQNLIIALMILIAGRDDHVECAYYRAILLPRSQEKKQFEMLKEAGEKGSHGALKVLISTPSNLGKNYWYYLYLAGKYKLYKINPDEKMDYFQQSFRELQNHEIAMGAEYKKNLALLAEYNEYAKTTYDHKFGDEEGKEKTVEIKLSHPESISTEWVDMHGNKTIKIIVKPSDQHIYVDFTFLTFKDGGNISLMLDSNESSISNYLVWADLVLQDDSLRRLAVRETHFGLKPKRMRVNVAPGDKNFEIMVLDK